MTQLYSFQKRFPASEYDPISWDQIPETWKTLKGAIKAADKWKKGMAQIEVVVETRIVELVPEGTYRVPIPFVEFQDRYFPAVPDERGKYIVQYHIRSKNIQGSIGSKDFDHLRDHLRVQANCMGSVEQLTPIMEI